MNNGKEVNIILNIVCILGILFSSIFLMFGICFSSLSSIESKHLTAQTEGVVINLKENSDGLLAPMVKYKVDDKEYQVTSNVYSNPSPYSLNQEVVINYDPQHPTMFTIEGELQVTNLVGIIFSFVGGGLVIVFIAIRIIIGHVLKKKISKL